jgi:hypothetical protein
MHRVDDGVCVDLLVLRNNYDAERIGCYMPMEEGVKITKENFKPMTFRRLGLTRRDLTARRRPPFSRYAVNKWSATNGMKNKSVGEDSEVWYTARCQVRDGQRKTERSINHYYC